jgi:hypothetical protein
MNNIGLEIVFWTVLALYILTKIGIFKKWKYQIGNTIQKKKENDILNRRHYVLHEKDVDSY